MQGAITATSTHHSLALQQQRAMQQAIAGEVDQQLNVAAN
jgi:hypothetical protein